MIEHRVLTKMTAQMGVLEVSERMDAEWNARPLRTATLETGGAPPFSIDVKIGELDCEHPLFIKSRAELRRMRFRVTIEELPEVES